MNKAIKKKWVDALLSGKYKQAKGQLKLDCAYCCLGVLITECNGRTPLDQAHLDFDDNDQFGLDWTAEYALASVNDYGVPFEMIAGLIDEAL